jgi:lantibiotic modifying enzyme
LVLKQIIAGLKKFAIIDNGQYSWYMNEKLRGAFSANTVNLGVAHGLPSILKFLSTCFKYQIDPVNSKQMAVGTTLKIQSSYQDFSLFGSCFPTVIDEQVKNSKSRLGWCYGDLGISYLLFTSGIDLNDSTVMNYAIDVLKLQTTRKSARQESVLDAGLCHGTSGIALIFEQIYRATKIYSFRQSAKFWIDETLDLSKFSDGLAGFKTIKKTTESNYILSSGFLEGISGTGLALISAISQRPQLWTEILLLNN